MQERPLLALPLTLSETVSAYRFVTAAGAHVEAGAAAHGVSQQGGASTDLIAATVAGTAILESGGAISANGEVQSDAVGRAVASAGGVILGRALQAATGAGQRIEVLLYQQLGAKFGQVLVQNDVTVISADGAVPISGIALIAGGTGLAGLTLAAPQPGAQCRIRVASLTSGNVVITTAAGVTFDGTNNTATMNAVADELVLGFKSATEWHVIENISTTLSSV